MENTTEKQVKKAAEVKINYQAVKGNLTNDPEIKILESGTKVANFSIKQSFPIGTPKEGQKQEYVNNYHHVVAFGDQADLVEKAGYKKGDFIEAEGKASFFSYQKEGVEGMNYGNKIIANNIQKLEAGVKPFQKHNNYIELKGNLTKDPEIKVLPSGQEIANISVAHNYKVKDKEDQVMFVNATIFNEKTVDAIKKSTMEKGSTISLKGSVEPSTYIDKNQNNRYSVSIYSNFVQLNKSKEVVLDHQNTPTPEIVKEIGKKPANKKEAPAKAKVKKDVPKKDAKKRKGVRM